jgi:predicted RNase H-like HicB family nuclease
VITFKVEVEQEEDGRWLAEVLELPGVLAHGEAGPQFLSISFAAA